MKETGLKIKIVGTPVLRSGVKQVELITEYHKALLSSMARIMYDVNGIGLAAPQVGIDEALIVVDDGTNGLFKLINPKIVKRDGVQSIEEGCLSVPGVGVKVKRAKKITLEALDESGKKIKIEAEGLLATVFQHEIDHLNGTLIIDHASIVQKMRLKKKLKELEKDNK